MSELLGMDEPRRRFAAMMSGLDIHYDLGEGHPLLGRRMPDLDLVTANGPLRVFTLLHDARPVLLNFGEPGGFDITPWADRVQLVDAKYVGVWELPVLGAVPAPTAVLIRPDGYVAWVGDLTGRARRCADHLVRTACRGVAHRLPVQPKRTLCRNACCEIAGSSWHSRWQTRCREVLMIAVQKNFVFAKVSSSQLICDIRRSCAELQHRAPTMLPCRFLAHRVISLPRGNSVAFGLKRTLGRIL